MYAGVDKTKLFLYNGIRIKERKGQLMKIKRYFIAFIFAAAVFLCGSLWAFADGTDEIPAKLNEFRRSVKCGSVSAVVYREGELSFYGDSDMLYQIGSMTKAFTGLAAEKLIKEGAISESDEVSELLKGFTAYYEGSPAAVTVGQLLAQTSGYTNSEKDYPSAAEGMSLSERTASISGKDLSAPPGRSTLIRTLITTFSVR